MKNSSPKPLDDAAIDRIIAATGLPCKNRDGLKRDLLILQGKLTPTDELIRQLKAELAIIHEAIMGKTHRKSPEDRTVAYERARKAAAEALHELNLQRLTQGVDEKELAEILGEANAQLEGDDIEPAK